METLWAPWRMQYIKRIKDDDGCIFCEKCAETKDRQNLILYRSESCFVMMNYYPYNNGHLLVVPYLHTADFSELSDEISLEIMRVIRKSTAILSAVMKCQGFNIGVNLGRCSGAGIDQHIHFHIVPRWNGDTNFMPVTGHTKVVNEALFETWETLKQHFKAK
ncbi:HIT domain-containing protein [candidate division KSB1 bacterium]|nr:HIT domain-containing protein [candidate division KSB1 bacterium]